MSDRYNSIIIGAGHNALVCAAYLAKSGQRVLVPEASRMPGGLGASREFHPGFHASVAHSVSHFSRKMAGDLKLASHGFDTSSHTVPTIRTKREQQTCRPAKGLSMPAMEFNEALRTVNLEHDQTPFELNLGWLVDFNKPHFSGRAALLKEKQRGPKFTLTKLDVEGNKPAEGSYIYANKRCTREIGYVTSAMWSPAVKANIALAMIKTEHLEGNLWAEIYYEKELRQYSRVARCTRKDKPFWTAARARATPPLDF